MQEKIENFVRYSIRYQLLLAQHVAKICNKNIYVFNGDGYFDKDDVFVEIIDGVRTVFKNGKRAVLSIAVQQSFGSDESSFLQFVDDNIVQKDDLGLYVVIPIEKIDIIPENQTTSETENQTTSETENQTTSETDSKTILDLQGEESEKKEEVEEAQVDLKEIIEAVEKIESVL